jgi:small subunit ribosomal protein S17e
MGRIKSTAVKNLAKEIISVHRNKLTTDFDKNKKIVSGLRDIESKKIRNIVAGYITKEMEKEKAAKESGSQ